MDHFTAISLNDHELGVALRAAGVVPQSNSPLGRIRVNGDANPALLRQHGMLDARGGLAYEWRSALSALSAPAAFVWVAIGSGEQASARMFVPAEGGFVGHAQANGAHQLAMPFAPDNLVSSLLDALSASNVGTVRPISESLWPDELAALAALSDWYREEGLRAMLERRSPQLAQVSLEQLDYELRWAEGSDDLRWLCALLRQHSGDAFAPRRSWLQSGVNGFAGRQLLQLDGTGGLTPSDSLQGLCFLLSNTTPSVMLVARGLNGSERQALLVRSLVAIMTFEFLLTDKGEHYVRVSAIDADLARELLYACVMPVAEAIAAPQLAEPHYQPPQDQRTTVAPSRPPRVADVRPTAASAPAPAAPAAAHRNVCRNPSCGREIAAGRKFCPSCGTPAV